jgi:alpha-mannosidase
MKMKKNLKADGVISRRKFLNQSAAGTVFIALNPLGALSQKETENQTWYGEASKYRVHMIGNAHIDPVWLWPWTEGISVVYSTFRSALERMKENPDVTFTASSAQFYQWIADNEPEMLEEIKQRVNEGRWNIAGGWWVEPDVNIPSGEAMVRQGLYGQLTFKRLLGHRATVATNPDSFGHTSTLPQIIKGQGMDNYIFMRPGVREKNLPGDLFWWEGIDGSKVLTYRIPISYTDNGSVRKRIKDSIIQLKGQPQTAFMAYYGAGDHGGGATKENIRSIEEVRKEKRAPEVFFSTTDRYFEEIRNNHDLNLPVVNDDLQYHAVGCYTAGSDIKKGNRQSETALVTAEKIASIGAYAWGAKYPGQEFTSAWQRVLFLQFHDSLAGTSLEEHYTYAQQGYGFATDIAKRAMYTALQKLESRIAAEDPESQYLLVFNPHAWQVTGQLEYDFYWNLAFPSKVEDDKGNLLSHQWVFGSTETGSRNRLLVNLTVPPFGYRQIRLQLGVPTISRKSVSSGENFLENEFLKITFSENGSFSLFDKETGREVFTGGATGCRAIVLNDPSDTWSHDIKAFADEAGAFSSASFKLMENGPLRARLRVRSTYGNSVLSIDWLLYTGSRKIEALVTLDWHEHLKMLKFSFPCAIESPVATYETPYGNIERETDGHENPGQRWINITGNAGERKYGLTVINDAKYGYSVSGNDMRISVTRSSIFAHHNPRIVEINAEHLWMDQGIQTFRMMLVPHRGTWKENSIVRTAEEFNSPFLMIYQGIHQGNMPASGSFISTDSQGIIVSSVKLAESGEDLIIRCVETNGNIVEAGINLHFAGQKWKGIFHPYEIKTLRFSKDTRLLSEVNLLEE